MYSSVFRSDEYKQRLLDFIYFTYNLKAVDIIPSKRGFYGETWQLETKDNRYFLKLVYAPEHKYIYERSFLNNCTKIAVNFSVYRGGRPQEYTRIARAFDEDRREKAQ